MPLPHKMQGAKNWMVFDERTSDLIKKGMVRRDAETLRDLLNATSQPGAKVLEPEGTKKLPTPLLSVRSELAVPAGNYWAGSASWRIRRQ
jgi:hypothetical protein